MYSDAVGSIFIENASLQSPDFRRAEARYSVAVCVFHLTFTKGKVVFRLSIGSSLDTGVDFINVKTLKRLNMFVNNLLSMTETRRHRRH